MIDPDTLLSIYEVRGEVADLVFDPPTSFVGLWNEEEFSYLFFTRCEEEFVNGLVRDAGLALGARHEMRYEDWQTGLPSQGLAVAGVCFVPSDHPAPPPGALLLDPSVVFGDGNHPTTTSCLRFMNEITSSRHILSMLDLGTGTGILALAGAAMGIGRIVAVDKNRLAVHTAAKNVEANSLGEVIGVREGEARLFIDRPTDLVAANLPFQVLRDVVTLRDAGRHGAWIVSGINEEQAEVIRSLLNDQGYSILGSCSTPPWATFMAISESYGWVKPGAD